MVTTKSSAKVNFQKKSAYLQKGKHFKCYRAISLEGTATLYLIYGTVVCCVISTWLNIAGDCVITEYQQC